MQNTLGHTTQIPKILAFALTPSFLHSHPSPPRAYLKKQQWFQLTLSPFHWKLISNVGSPKLEPFTF
jgi:hypothetical protein